MNSVAADRAPYRVLVFPGGTEIGLEIAKSLALRKEVELFSAGAPVSSHAPFAFRHHFDVPHVGEPAWLAALEHVVREHGITHIFPAHDDALLALARNAAGFSAKIVTSSPETCEIARSKRATYRRLAGVVATPRAYESADDVEAYPVFLKPDRGQGSQQATRIDSRAQLNVVLPSVPDPLVMEYLPGDEYTVDCFSDRERGLLFVGPRRRVRTRSGISMNTVAFEEPALHEMAQRIAGALSFHGAWFFQAKRDAAGMLKLLEIAPRIAGASALQRVRGVNLALLSLYEAERVPVEILLNPGEVELDRALVNRYRHNLRYDTLYIDLDDTLIVRGQVNPQAAALLFQCHNRDVRVVLLTRRSDSLEETLARHCLAQLIDEIIYVPRGAPKSDHVAAGAAVFIDDSFAERREVAAKLGLPTFDSAMLEFLLDDRV